MKKTEQGREEEEKKGGGQEKEDMKAIEDKGDEGTYLFPPPNIVFSMGLGG